MHNSQCQRSIIAASPRGPRLLPVMRTPVALPPHPTMAAPCRCDVVSDNPNRSICPLRKKPSTCASKQSCFPLGALREESRTRRPVSGVERTCPNATGRRLLTPNGHSVGIRRYVRERFWNCRSWGRNILPLGILALHHRSALGFYR